MPGTGDAGDSSSLQRIPTANVFSSATPTATPNFPSKYEELENQFNIHETIGSGGFSKVKLATEKSSGAKVAIKIVDKEHVGTELPRIALEIKTLQPLCHSHICKLDDVIYSEKKIFMIMEYCPTDLYEYIVKKDAYLSENESRKIFTQLMSAVVYLHANGIAHRDLKPENVLLDFSNNVKLTDFGLCAVLKRNGINRAILKTMCGSPAYCAPELLKNIPYIGSKADVWSLGVILFVLLSGQLPFFSKNLRDLYRKIQEAQFSFPEWFSEGAKDIIKQLLEPNVNLRPSLYQLWSHPWIQAGDLESFQEEIENQTTNMNSNSINELGDKNISNSIPKLIVQLMETSSPSAKVLKDPLMLNEENASSSSDSIRPQNGNAILTNYLAQINKNHDTNNVIGLKAPPTRTGIRKIFQRFLRGLAKARGNILRCMGRKQSLFFEDEEKVSCDKSQDVNEPLQITLATLLSPQHPRRRKRCSGLTVVDEQFADCILDKLQLALQSMGIESQRKGQVSQSILICYERTRTRVALSFKCNLCLCNLLHSGF